MAFQMLIVDQCRPEPETPVAINLLEESAVMSYLILTGYC